MIPQGSRFDVPTEMQPRDSILREVHRALESALVSTAAFFEWAAAAQAAGSLSAFFSLTVLVMDSELMLEPSFPPKEASFSLPALDEAASTMMPSSSSS